MPFWQRKKKNNRSSTPQNPKWVLFKQILVGALIFSFIALLGTGIWYGSRVESLTLSEVEVVGGETINHAQLYQIAGEELDGAYYRLVPKRFAWTFPEDALYGRIQSIERIKNVHIERTSGRKLVIAFEEYQPFALWCETLTTNECLFLDKEGFAFGKAPKLDGGAFVRFSEVDRVPEKGVYVFSGEFIRNAESFISKVYDELNINIIQVERTAEDDVTYHIAGGGQLKVSLRISSEETFDNLETILLSEEFNHIEPGNFQYIDLRYGNKIFVNEEEPKVEGVSTSTSTSTE